MGSLGKTQFDSSRAYLHGPNYFQRAYPVDSNDAISLSQAGLDGAVEVFVVERSGEKLAFVAKHMAHPHVAQGTLGGQPFLLVFCCVCHSAVGMTPTVDGSLRHFSAGGLYDGVILICDDETASYWDQLSGTCVHGPSSGKTLDVWPVRYSTVAMALKSDPKLKLYPIRARNPFDWVLRWMTKPIAASRGWFPPGFRKTMLPVDARLAEMTVGLGVVSGDRARFYPLSAIEGRIEESWSEDRSLLIDREADGLPRAAWSDAGVPVSLLCRWYGFSASYPDCEVYAPSD